MISPPTDSTLRDVARLAVRQEVLRHAWDLFAVHGFEATTLEQVAEASGMSRRTFFRYFESKDDLLIVRLLESGDLLCSSLSEQPEELQAWTALRAAFEVFIQAQKANPDKSRRLQLMVRDEAGVRASVEERRRQWIASLAPLVEERLQREVGIRDLRMESEALAGAALACMDAAQSRWAEDPSLDLSLLFDRVMNAVKPLRPTS